MFSYTCILKMGIYSYGGLFFHIVKMGMKVCFLI